MKNKPANIIVHGRRLACENSKFEVFFDHQELRFFEAAEMAMMAENSEIQDPGTLVSYFELQVLSGRG